MPTWYSDFTQGLISKANAQSSTPYQPYSGNRIAGFNPAQEQAFGNVARNTASFQNQTDSQGNITGGAFAPAASNISQAASQTALGASPMAQGAYSSALGFNPYAAAQPGLAAASYGTGQNAGQNSYSGVQNYLNPYTSSVVNEVGRLGAERLAGQESNIRDQFIKSGQFGSSRQSGAMGSAARASQRDILGQQSALLNSGYQQAMGQQQADLARQLQAYQQQGALAGQMGSAAAQAQQGYAGIGSQLANLSQSDLARQLQGGQTLGNLAAQAGTSSLQQNAALEASGAQQGQKNQQNLDVAYQDFLNQVNHPSQQLSFMNSIIRGIQVPTQQSASSTGAAASYGASPLSQLASAGAGFGSLLARNP